MAMYTDPHAAELQKAFARRRRFRRIRSKTWFLLGTVLLTAALHLCSRAEKNAADIPAFTRPMAQVQEWKPQTPEDLGMGGRAMYVGGSVSRLDGLKAYENSPLMETACRVMKDAAHPEV